MVVFLKKLKFRLKNKPIDYRHKAYTQSDLVIIPYNLYIINTNPPRCA